mmetsp:Transcript_21449/g.27734  ORF Transcript_21449/g.27734 Transcript_21449/m.27734 type:complete len:391 (+) Transcript_21449:118-1290(+)
MTSSELYEDNSAAAPPAPVVSNASEAETIRRVLSILKDQENKRLQNGFNKINFTLGVLNTIVIAYMLGAHPEHFWLLFLVEVSILVPMKMYQDYTSKPLCNILYYLDYCWIMNFLIIVALYSLLFYGKYIDPYVRQQIYMATLGVGCGSILGATAVLPFAATVFHDNKIMTSLFVHIVPPCLLYTFMWHSDEIVEAWPTVFHLKHTDIDFYPSDQFGPFFLPTQGLGTVSGNAMNLYYLWWACYYIWMVVNGLELTRTRRDANGKITKSPKYDTVYYGMVKDGFPLAAGKLWGRKKEVSKKMMMDGTYDYRDLTLYMSCHAVMIFVATNFIAYGCMRSKAIHATFIWILVIICVYRGSSRYTYWATSSSSKSIEKQYKELLKGSKFSKEE